MLEMRIEPYSTPAALQWNFDELKAALTEKVKIYESMVYNEDQIKDAKADRADLNRLKKALNDERLNREREYLEPFNAFKNQIKELCAIIDRASASVDEQVKTFEETQKAEKAEQIKAYWESCTVPDGIALEEVFEARWLNASVSMKSIQDNIDASLDKINQDLAVVRNLPSYAFEAEQKYIQTLDLAAAVSEAHRLSELAEKKAAWEAEQAKQKAECEAVDTCAKCGHAPCENTPEVVICETESTTSAEPGRKWIGFQALLSVDEAKALGSFFRDNGIKYKSI